MTINFSSSSNTSTSTTTATDSSSTHSNKLQRPASQMCGVIPLCAGLQCLVLLVILLSVDVDIMVMTPIAYKRSYSPLSFSTPTPQFDIAAITVDLVRKNKNIN
eukprot:gene9100-1403_t